MSPYDPPDNGPAIGTFVYPDLQEPDPGNVLLGFALVGLSGFVLGVLAAYVFISL